jgi:hypothetical protein
VEQELLIFPEHLSSPPVLSWVRVTRSLVLCVCFVDRCLSFRPFFVGHCVFCFTDSDYPFGVFKQTFEVMTSTLPIGTLGLVASLLAATLYQRNPDRNHMFWNILSTERYILHMLVHLIERNAISVSQMTSDMFHL